MWIGLFVGMIEPMQPGKRKRRWWAASRLQVLSV